jgi:hypothetical protein
MAMKIHVAVFWFVTPCSDVVSYNITIPRRPLLECVRKLVSRPEGITDRGLRVCENTVVKGIFEPKKRKVKGGGGLVSRVTKGFIIYTLYQILLA